MVDATLSHVRMRDPASLGRAPARVPLARATAGVRFATSAAHRCLTVMRAVSERRSARGRRLAGLWPRHSRYTLFASWELARQLATQYGWSFGSHSATYPDSESKWALVNVHDETCATERALVAHGIPGAAGLFAWPDNYVYPPAL